MTRLLLAIGCLLLATACRAETIVCIPMDSDPGWNAEGRWEFGIPEGKEGDPSSAHTGSNVYGYNLAGPYENDMPEYCLTTSAINCKLAENVALSFWRWLGVESSLFDHARIQISNDGTNWSDVWANGKQDLTDSSWVYCEYDVSDVADRQPSVFIRWCMGPSDFANTYGGWNIDDVCLTGDVLDGLSVSQKDVFFSAGPKGGPFVPACKSYTLRNIGGSPIEWVAAGTASWLEAIPNEGAVAPNSRVVVDVCVSADSNALAEAKYAGTVSFTNTTSGFSHQVGVTLYVGAATCVPLHFPTIQSAINAASEGDTITVLDGVYTGYGNRDVDFKGKALTLKSANGPADCIIDCEKTAHFGFYFHSGENTESVLDGFTIKGVLKGGPGGGIYCKNSSPTIRNCIIMDNNSDAEMYPWDSAYGGGIYCDNSSPLISNCVVSANRSGNRGGGIYCSNNSSLVIVDSTIADNVSFTPNYRGAGGGMYNDSSNPTLINCKFINNRSVTGGGVDNVNSNAKFINCVFSGNSTYIHEGGTGGAMSNWGGNPTLLNCLFVANSSYWTAGMINLQSNPLLTNCSFIYNSSVSLTGETSAVGITNRDSKPTLTNCILWGNSRDGSEGESAQIRQEGAGRPIINYSCVQGLTGDLGGIGNMGFDPLFADADAGDYHLKSSSGRWDPRTQNWVHDDVTSPCIDSGDPNSDVGTERWPHGRRINMGSFGGTAQASMSGSLEGNLADLDNDGAVSAADYALFSAGWYAGSSMTIPKGQVVVDGDLTDWSGHIEWSAFDRVYYGSPRDVSHARFALQWDPSIDKIYAAVVVQDSDHVFLDEYVKWDASDRIEVYSQGDAEGGSGWTGVYDVAQHYMIAPDTSGGSWATWGRGELIDPNVGLEYAVSICGDTIIYEIGVPQFDRYGGFGGVATVAAELAAGNVIRLDVVVDSRSSAGFGMVSENLMLGKYDNADSIALYKLVEASERPACPNLSADLDKNCSVNFADLVILAESWLWQR